MNEIIRRGSGTSQIETNAAAIEGDTSGQVFDEERIVSIVGEVIAWAKDDRLNTKRAISSDTASRAMVQKQNGQLVDVCESMLQRDDLTNEQRLDILNKMCAAASSTERVDEESRAFQREQLSYSHKRSGQLLTLGAIVVLGVGGAALCWNRPT
ncbi:MAG: hypothetical protein J6D54_06860 [Olsenella sp.]|nr:hypothetical protein [Olsenella sp.]